MAFGSLILTDAAEGFTAQAWASSGVITVTRTAYGSGFPGTNDYVPGYTNLKTFVMNGTITSINDIVAGQLTVRTNISSANAPSTFNVNEIGIFGNFNGGAETLLAYATTGANTGDTVTPTGGGTPVIKDYAWLMIFNQAVNVTGTIQLVQAVGAHAGSHRSNGIDPIAVATSTLTGLVPVTPNNATQVLLGGATASWGPVPIVPTPLVTTSANGLCPKLSGSSATYLDGTGNYSSSRMPGEVVDYAGPNIPAGWLLCDGSAVSRFTYSALFAAIGGIYGGGDGFTTFNLPDTRGRVSIGSGTGFGLTPRALAQTFGEENHALSVAEIPFHSHGVNDPSHAHTASHSDDFTHVSGTIADYNHAIATRVIGGEITADYTPGSNILRFLDFVDTLVTVNPSTTGITIQGAGGNGAHNNCQPGIVFNKIIKT